MRFAELVNANISIEEILDLIDELDGAGLVVTDKELLEDELLYVIGLDHRDDSNNTYSKPT